jgi:hypothetical protein
LASRQVLAKSPAVTVNMPVIVSLLLAETGQFGMEKRLLIPKLRVPVTSFSSAGILYVSRRFDPKADGKVPMRELGNGVWPVIPECRNRVFGMSRPGTSCL